MGAERFGVKGYWPPTGNINSEGCLCEFIMSESVLLNVWICNKSLHKFTLVPSSELVSQEWKQTRSWLNWNSLVVTCVALLLCYSHCYLFWLDLVIFGSVLHFFLWKNNTGVYAFSTVGKFNFLKDCLPCFSNSPKSEVFSSSMVISSLECEWHYLLLKKCLCIILNICEFLNQISWCFQIFSFVSLWPKVCNQHQAGMPTNITIQKIIFLCFILLFAGENRKNILKSKII